MNLCNADCGYCGACTSDGDSPRLANGNGLPKGRCHTCGDWLGEGDSKIPGLCDSCLADFFYHTKCNVCRREVEDCDPPTLHGQIVCGNCYHEDQERRSA